MNCINNIYVKEHNETLISWWFKIKHHRVLYLAKTFLNLIVTFLIIYIIKTR